MGGLAHPVTAVADTTPPSVTAAFYTAGLITSKIHFDFDENLPSVYRLPDALKSAFSVSVDGTAREIENIYGGSGRELWLKRRVFTGQTIVVSYDQSVAGTDAIADADGNKLASFTTGSGGVPAVLNNSNLAAPGSNTAAITNLWLRNDFDSDSVVSLTPSFAQGTTSYAASMGPRPTSLISVRSNWTDIWATMEFLDADDMPVSHFGPSDMSFEMLLRSGVNVLKMKLTAEDGITTQTTILTVTRAAGRPHWRSPVSAGNGLIQLTWSAPYQTSGVTRHEYRYKTTGDYPEPESWTPIPDSGVGGANETSYTVMGLSNGTTYTLELRRVNGAGPSFATLERTLTPSGPEPVFNPATATREVLENSAAGTNVGAVIPEATPADSGDTLTYSLEGTDKDSFDFDASTRQITTKTGVTYNHEEKSSYSVEVQASDDTESGTLAVTINVTDVNEKSAKPAKPTLAKVTGSSTSLTATWTKPDLNGGPEITGYDVAYREGTTDVGALTHVTSGLTTTITGLTADTSYQVRVRAKNGETDSDWSDASDAVSTNAATPVPTLSIADAAASEGEAVTFTATLSAADAADVTATWTASIGSGDTAVAADLGTTKTGTVTVSIGNKTRTFQVSTVEDTASEANETFTVTLSGVSANATLGTATATGTINNDDAPAAPTITGAVPGDAQVTLSWEAPASDSGITRYEYRYDFDDDGRTGSVARWEPIPDSGVGGANQAGYTVTGLVNRVTYTFILRAANPADVGPSASSDPARPVSVADAALTGLSLGAAGTLLPSFALDRTTYTAEVAHGVEEVTVTPTASNPAATIEYLDASDAALADADPAAGQQVAVAVGDTDIKVKVTSPDGTMTQTYTVTVRRAASGMPWLSVADAEGSEADGVTFTVTLSEAVTEAVTATWTAIPSHWYGSSDPVDDADLTSTTGMVTVTAGETMGTFTVTTENDATDENDQTFRVTLSDPSSNAAISDADVSGATARGTILDDDDPPEISIAGSAAAEGDAVTFTLTLSMLSELPVDVDWETSVQSDDTATPGTDFTAANGTARIGPEYLIKKINVMALADTDDSEDEETFTVTLSDPRNATLGTKNTAQGTITVAVPNRPTSFIAAPGDEQVELSWAAPASDADITRHEYRHMIPGETYPETWTEIADSAPGSTNEAGFTATGLTNETAYTFELRAVNDGGAGAAAEAGPVTPTPGICDRTEQVKVAILDRLRRIDDCAVVTVANLSWVSYLYMMDSGITSLQSGDFAGLSNLSQLDIFGGSITALPADVFSGLTKLEGLQLYNNELSALPDSVFSGLTALEVLGLKGNKLQTLPANAFSDLTNLEVLNLANNKLTSLPANAFSGLQNLKYLWLTRHELTELPATVFSGLKALMILEMPGRTLTSLPATVFSGLTNLRTLSLHGNQVHPLPADVFSGLTNLTGLNLIDTNLDSFPENVFSDLTNLTTLLLRENNLSSLPDGLLDGLTGLTTLRLEENTSEPLPLTVTVEKVGTDQVRAKVLAAAPFAVDIPVTVENGALDGGATVLSVAAGSVEGTPVTVTRTAGTAAAVTVDVDLTTPPSFPTDRPTTPWDTNLAIGGHYGYAFVKAASGLPKEILPVLPAPDAPTGLEAARAGDGNVKLSWDAPESGANITRHEYRYKTGTGAYPETWTDIADSAPGETNEDGYTVTGLTNEIAHTFQLRAVNAAGGGTAVEADPVTPTPGICGRTAKIQEVILAELADVSECAAVTVANLASITGFGGALGLATFGQGITSLEAGDFGGLTALTKLNLGVNDLTTLPAGIFSGLAAIKDILLNGNELTALPEGTFAGITTLAVIDLASNSFTAIPARTFEDLTALTQLDLSGNDLTALPDGLFSGLSALESLSLSGNDLAALPAGLFSGLSALSTLTLYENDLVSLPAGLFSGLTALDTLDLEDNDLTALPDRLFNGLTALESLRLEGNDLTALPDGLLSGLTKLRVLTLGDNPNTGDVLALTVTVERVGTDQARAKVLAGAPAAVEFTPTVANGSLPTGVTKLAVAAGSVNGTAVTVTRTTGTMAAVTVDIDLSTQPTLASGFTGFTFAKAASGLPAEILPDTRSPQNFTAKPGDGQAALAWTAPASGSGVTKHQYRQKEGSGSYPANWTDIPNSAEGGANEDGYTVTGLTNETVYTFELKRFVGTTESATAESNAVTPTPGICDRTQQVRDGILAELADVAECEAVTVANLAGIGRLDLDDKGIASLEAGDFAGLTGMTALILNDNDLTSLPAGVFSGLTALSSLLLVDNDLSSLPGAVFSGLTALRTLGLHENALSSLPGTVFSGLTSLRNVDLHDNDLTSLPGGLFSGLTALVGVDVSGNDLTSLPDGLFSGLTGLDALALGGNPNAGDTLPLTVTLEKVGEDRVRAKVLAGAPFAVAIPVTPANGTLAGGVTVLTVAAGSVGSAAVTVTRTDGTTDAVTVDVDLSTQPSPPSNYSHSGYTFEKAASGLPAEILPEAASLEPPTGLAATPGDRRAVLAWTPPAADSGFTRHQYRYRTDGDFGDWTDIPDSGPGGANASRYTVTDLANAVEHTFELRARDAGAGKSDPATVAVEPTGPPRIVSVEVVSGPGLDNGQTYGEGEEIRIEVTFDQPVVVTGDPELALDVGGPRLAGLESGGGTEVLVFVYVVTEDDEDADGVSVGRRRAAAGRQRRHPEPRGRRRRSDP